MIWAQKRSQPEKQMNMEKPTYAYTRRQEKNIFLRVLVLQNVFQVVSLQVCVLENRKLENNSQVFLQSFNHSRHIAPKYQESDGEASICCSSNLKRHLLEASILLGLGSRGDEQPPKFACSIGFPWTKVKILEGNQNPATSPMKMTQSDSYGDFWCSFGDLQQLLPTMSWRDRWHTVPHHYDTWLFYNNPENTSSWSRPQVWQLKSRSAQTFGLIGPS